ncbi:hypothetical protein TNCV_2447581 [Trichonephila clavipes]|uniref:Uncharacterized protein n=1 Tax=Trichonephila clavipes TaxID=2585209 RepID=A0A8X6SP14_TRICX|nr:hypothetical protein TNCV_2447581 [Trichonephila clavipes]
MGDFLVNDCSPTGIVISDAVPLNLTDVPLNLTAVPLNLRSNPGDSMGAYKCIVSLRHGGSLISRRAANPLVILSYDQFKVFSLKFGVKRS